MARRKAIATSDGKEKSAKDRIEERKKMLSTPKNEDKKPIVQRIRTYIEETRAEMKKVTWPVREEVMHSTSVVLITVLFFTAFIGILDFLLNKLIGAIFFAK